MNVQNNIGFANYTSFKGGTIKLKSSEVQKAIKTFTESSGLTLSKEEAGAVRNLAKKSSVSQNAVHDSDVALTKDEANVLKVLALKLLEAIRKSQPRTIHFFDAYKMHQEAVDFARGQQIYKKVIDKCLKDIDTALETGRPKEEVDKLFDTLEIFTTKYGHYGT